MISIDDDRLEYHRIPTQTYCGFETVPFTGKYNIGGFTTASERYEKTKVFPQSGLTESLKFAGNDGWIAGSYVASLMSFVENDKTADSEDFGLADEADDFDDIDIFARSPASYCAIVQRIEASKYHVIDNGRIAETSISGLSVQVICPHIYEHWGDPFDVISEFDFLHISCFVLKENVIAGLRGFKQAIDDKQLIWTQRRPWNGSYARTVMRALKYISRGYNGEKVLQELSRFSDARHVFEALYYFRLLNEDTAAIVEDIAVYVKNDFPFGY